MSLFLLRVIIFGLDDSSLPELEAYFCICLTKPLQVPCLQVVESEEFFSLSLHN